ncbi:MAG: GtrA family protein, partial [Mesorhizobium sp.]
YSGHRVFAGPYHRNIAGDLLALDAFQGSSADARAVVATHHVGLIAVCRGNAESELLAAKAPQGFLAGLMRISGGSLELYRVRLDR